MTRAAWILALLVTLLAAGCNNAPASATPREAPPVASAASPEPATRYACPMHPEVTDTKASDCPKCGMKLVPASAGVGSAH